MQKHSSQDTIVADYKLPYYIHLLPLDVLRQTLNVSAWGRVYLLGGLGLGEGCIAWAPSGKEWGISRTIIDELALLLSSSSSLWKTHLNGNRGWGMGVVGGGLSTLPIAQRVLERSEKLGRCSVPSYATTTAKEKSTQRAIKYNS